MKRSVIVISICTLIFGLCTSAQAVYSTCQIGRFGTVSNGDLWVQLKSTSSQDYVWYQSPGTSPATNRFLAALICAKSNNLNVYVQLTSAAASSTILDVYVEAY